MKKLKITITIILILISSGLLISKLYDKHITPVYENPSTNTCPLTPPSTTTTETTKTSKKTTKKHTTKVEVKINTKTNTKATGSKQEYLNYAKSYGNLNDTQLTCLNYLWEHESGWNPNSVNKSSGACGIPQAYPCKKIQATEGSNDWKAQIRWGIKYINSRYKNPCAAWNHFKNKKWY